MVLDHTFFHDRNRQPHRTIHGFDAVTIAPAMFVILNIVIENKNIRFVDLMKISPPWDVIWLVDDTLHTTESIS
jgi:hypothetical protein